MSVINAIHKCAYKVSNRNGKIKYTCRKCGFSFGDK